MSQAIDAVERVAVLGAGQMGRGIAQVVAQSGFEVKLFDISSQALERAREFIAAQLERGVAKGKWDGEHQRATMSRIATGTELGGLKDCDFAIEAASEDKKIKFQLFRELDRVLPPQAVLASNTSSISITEMAAVTTRPARVVGMHFMNPVPVMKLVEGVRGLETSDETFLMVEGMAERMGKVVVTAQDMPGFAVNRVLMPMINEACFALQEGTASALDMDRAMKLGCNFPMGPLELADFIGLDTCLAIMNVLFEGMGDPKYRPCPLLKQYVTAGRLGRKSGRGFFTYDDQEEVRP